MKLLCGILTFWTLALSGWPCTDECHRHRKETNSTAQGQPAEHHDHEAPCSPFCACGACHGASLPTLTFVWVLETSTEVSAAPEFPFLLPRLPEPLRSFWQPPKL